MTADIAPPDTAMFPTVAAAVLTAAAYPAAAAAAQVSSSSWQANLSTRSAMPAVARQAAVAAPSASAPGAPVWVVVRVDGPPTVAPGEAVTVAATVTNVSGETAQGLRLEVRNAAEARLIGRAVYQLAEIAPGAQMTVEVTGEVLARPGARLQTQLIATGGNLESDAVGAFTPLVRQDVADTWEPGPGAGLWRTPSGFLEIELPQGRDAAIKRISQRGLYDAIQPAPGALHRFEVTAEDETGAAIRHFTTPVTLRWRYGEALAAAPPLVPPVLAWWDETTGHWQILPTVADTPRGVIESQVDHFSQFGILPGAQQAPPDPFNGLDSDLFTGALSYRFPLPLATRPAGFAPGLALNYNSRRRDSQDGYGSAGSLVGFGWRLDGLDSIDAVDGGYALALGGATFTIKKTAAWVWYAEEAPGLQIARASSDEDADWHVRTPDGTHRIFKKIQTRWDCNTQVNPPVERERAKTFMLTSITAPADDGTYSYSINFTYNSDPNIVYTRQYHFYCGGDLTKSYTFQALPTQATYNGVNGHSVVVDFVYNTRSDLPAACQTADCTGADNDQLWYYYTRRLQDVTLKVDGQSMQRYHLTTSSAAPDGDHRHDRLLLDNVQSFGKNDALAQPPVSFTYKNAPGCQTGDNCRLETLNNGQGGLATFTYLAQGGAPANTHRLDYLALKDQVTNTEIQRAFWYNQWDTSAGGYDFVIVTHKGDLGTTADDLLDKHWYYISPSTPKGRWGQEYQAAHSDVNHKALDLTQWTLVEPPLPGGSPYQNVRYVVDTVRRYLYDANGANPQQAARQSYAYVLDHQDNVQAGNVTHLREYDAGDNLVRTTERWYHPCINCNGYRYIADRLAEEKVWQGDVNGACKAHTRFYYDDQTSHTNAPLKGLLTKVEAAQSTCGTGFVTRTQNSYDPTWHNLTRTQDGLARGVSYTYDTEFRAFVTTATNDLSQVTTTVYPTGDVVQRALGWPSQVTDANNQTTTFTYDALGRPRTVDRPLGAAVDEEWIYSDYGGAASPQRLLHKVRDDVTTPANPESGYLATWTFYDGLGRTLQTQGEHGNGNNWRTLTSQQHDGHGRLWRQSMPYSTNNNPGTYKSEDWTTAPPTHTRYAYDLLGRIVQVIQPDNSVTTTGYAYLTTSAIDALGHKVEQESDTLGRLAYTRNYTGIGTPQDPYVLYGAATQYQYDVLDRLDRVVGPDGNAMDPTYNLLGQKTQMVDPDMGTWTYGYDAAGNLTRQTDARGQTTCFYYDGLNRLKGKTYRADVNCPTSDPGYAGYTIKYYYDQNAHGSGRRTEMQDASGLTRWQYDGRGRVTLARKSFNGIGFVETGWTYDAADRVQSITYPGGEVVTTTYTSQGLPNALTNQLGSTSGAYVLSTTYDEAGRPDIRSLNNGLQTNYDYYAWTTANGRGRLFNIKTTVGAGGAARQDLRYGYDAVGNVTLEADALNVTGGTPGFQRQCFLYDALNRLLRAWTTAGYCNFTTPNPDTQGAQPYDESYTYQPNGNLATKGTTGAPASYSYGQQASSCPEGALAAKPHAVVAVGSDDYCYDQNGNLRRREIWEQTETLSYDAENRHTALSSTGGAQYAFTYDGDGARATAATGAGESATVTAYAGPLLELDRLYGEAFDDGLAQNWTAASGAWAVTSGVYRQSNAGASNTNAYRSQAQGQGTYIFRWVATFNSGVSAGFYLFASAGTGTERGNSYRIWQDATHVRIYENTGNSATLRASFAAAAAAGQTHTYQVTYDTRTGQLAVWRAGSYLGSWTDATPLTSGSYIALRTDNADVSFDSLIVLSVVKYYIIPAGGYSGSQRIALRRDGSVFYLLTDQLGSTRVTTDASGAPAAEMKYYPFGWTRYNSSGQKTTYRFTGQRYGPGGGGLYDYGARWYDSYLNRWIQPDTIIPNPGDPQSLNRYSYVKNNPLRFIDPTGHVQVCADGDYGGGCGVNTLDPAQVFWHAAKIAPELAEFYAMRAQHARNVLEGAPEIVLEAGLGAMENAWLRGQAALPQARFDPTVLIDPGMLGSLAQVGGGVIHKGTLLAISRLTKSQNGGVAPVLVGQPGNAGASNSKPIWPNTPGEMDAFTGVTGTHIPDTPSTPGRGKVQWQLADSLTVTYEQHPYHPGAPSSHSGPHWHLSYPTQPHTPGAIPGSPIPGVWIRWR